MSLKQGLGSIMKLLIWNIQYVNTANMNTHHFNPAVDIAVSCAIKVVSFIFNLKVSIDIFDHLEAAGKAVNSLFEYYHLIKLQNLHLEFCFWLPDECKVNIHSTFSSTFLRKIFAL